MVSVFGSGKFYERTVSRGRSRPPRQRGTRRVTHTFGRVVSTASAGWAMVAIPLLPGETMRQLHIDTFVCTDDQGAIQPDSAILYMPVVGMVPFDWTGTQTISEAAAEYNSFVTGLVEAVNKGPGEWDSNADATQVIRPSGLDSYEVMHAEWRMLTPIGQPAVWEVAEVLSVADSRHVDRYRIKVEKNYRAENGALVIYGIWSPAVSAQTEFGAGLMDSMSTSDLWEIIQGGQDELTDLSSAGQATLELLYGGDTYIESDTLKSFGDADHRFQGVAQAVIGTPWPRHGT